MRLRPVQPQTNTRLIETQIIAAERMLARTQDSSALAYVQRLINDLHEDLERARALPSGHDGGCCGQ